MSSGLEGVDGKVQSMFSVCVHVTGFNQSLSQRLDESERERMSDSSERQRQGQNESDRIRGTTLDIDGSLECRIGKGIERGRERGRDKGKRSNSNSNSNSNSSNNSKNNSNSNSKTNSRTNSKTNSRMNSRSNSASDLRINGDTSHHIQHYPVKQGRPNVEESISRIAVHGYRALVFVCGPAPMVAQAAALSMQYGVDFRHETFEL